jgi:hypothetical protein
MPVQYDLPEYQGASDVQDINQYQKLPFYLATLEAKMFPEWQVWDKMYGKLNWSANMGTTLRGVRAEPTPVGTQDFYPESIQGLPKKDVFENLETTEEATLSWHDFDSKQFYFLPSFQDFRENQIDFTHKDIVRQIAIRGDQFIRSFMTQKVPNVYVPGNPTAGESELVSAPYIPSGTAVTAANVAAAGKNPAFWAAQIAKLDAGGVLGLTLATLDDAVAVMRDDLMVPFFEGTVNTPKDNELIKGKYVVVSSSEAYQMLKYDPNFSQFRNINLSIVNDGFKGEIFGELTWKTERFPVRFKADGTSPAPQLYDAGNKRTRPNPEYVNAPYELAYVCGADAFKSIKIGPPPKPFSSGKMDAAKFYSMNWNGEVRLTDQIIVAYNDGAGNITQDLNYRGRFLKLFSSVVYGAIPVNAYNVLPIIFKRKRPADLIQVGEA